MQPSKSAIIIHGGVGLGSGTPPEVYAASLKKICLEAFRYGTGRPAAETAAYAVALMEDDPIFNAGIGSKLQKDGTARMTAALMDGFHERFSAAVNVTNAKPIEIAYMLQNEKHTILAGAEAEKYARDHGLRLYDPYTPTQRDAHAKSILGETGTVGAVVLDGMGYLAAATSTGGIGGEIPAG